MSKNTTYAALRDLPRGGAAKDEPRLVDERWTLVEPFEPRLRLACKSCPPNPYRREMIHLGTARITSCGSSDPLWTMTPTPGRNAFIVSSRSSTLALGGIGEEERQPG
ncbi:hypothetical protein DIPPA_15384 [Diplonema papillatum]|nr:hypothetical protein DIPPA_15384 [Diplonema papillatum]